MQRFLSRQELFDLVWAKPIRDIAPEFGFSDVYLSKLCKRNDIPLPGRGYWAKLAAGQKVPRPRLSSRALGRAETISFGRPSWPPNAEEDAALMAEDIPPAPVFSESLADLTARVSRQHDGRDVGHQQFGQWRAGAE